MSGRYLAGLLTRQTTTITLSASRQVHGPAELLGHRAGPEAQALRPAGLDAGPLGVLRPAHLVGSTARRSDALAPYQREVISIHLYTEGVWAMRGC